MFVVMVCMLGSTHIVFADTSTSTQDVTPPVITLIGSSTILVSQNTTYTDAGATATDDIDGDITQKIVVTNLVNTASSGTYSVTYNVSDAAGNAATPVVRAVDVTPVVVADTTPPVITLTGSSTVSITEGTTYVDAGATATDDVDGDITSHITSTSTVDVHTPGTYSVTYNVSDAAGNAAIPVVRTVIVTDPLIETILIRNGSTIIYQGTVPLPATGTVSIVDDASSTHQVNSDSVLGLLHSIGQTSGNFSISGVHDYGSMGLLLNCLTPTGQDQLCYNWNYIVNNVLSWDSIDSKILSGGETVDLYFGSSHQVLFNTTSITAGGSLTVTAQKYNYADNTWSSLTNVTIAVTQPNPSDTWNPFIIATSTVDSLGSATITLPIAGTYNVGIVEDGYYPYSVTVQNVVLGGGGGSSPATFNTINAVNYLTSVQDSDGSFNESNLYTDWAGIAFGSANVTGTPRTNILSYMSAHNTISSLLTDNERRAMSLLALGQNPYSFDGVDYITPIINSFDGTQFGDSSIVNDDIFALIPLASAGYTSSDTIITKDISFILGKQKSDGSWEESVDLTSAAIQSLVPFSMVSGVHDALTKAGIYLQNAQGADGGWGNISSSSWATQAMSALGLTWANSGKSTNDYLVSQQVSDGAVVPTTDVLQNRIWTTSYAIPASLGKSWNMILHAVSKPVVVSGGGESENVIPVQIQTTATTTKLVDTNTVVIQATSTATTTLISLLPKTQKLQKEVQIKPAVKSKKTKAQKSNFVTKIIKNLSSTVKTDMTSSVYSANTVNDISAPLSANVIGSENSPQTTDLTGVSVWSYILNKLFAI